MSNLQKHKKTHKTHHTSEDILISQEDEAENALSALTDGQHFIYVTADQQLVISTIAPNENEMEKDRQNSDFDSVMDSGVAITDLDGSQPPMDVELNSVHEVAEENISFVHNDDGPMQQAIEIMTDDGRRVTLIIPANNEECELSHDYQLES